MNNENMAGKCSLTIYDTEQLMGEATARKIASSLKKQASLGKKTALWLMAAPSAFAFYTAFTKMVAQDEKLKDVVTKTQFFQFDDYPIDKDSPKYVATFRYLLETKFFNGLSEACKKPLHVNLLNVKGDEHDAEVLDAYAKKIQGLCMDDSYYVIQLKGIGMDGHWGFHGVFPSRPATHNDKGCYGKPEYLSTNG